MIELSANIKLNIKNFLLNTDKRVVKILTESAYNIHHDAVSAYKQNGTNNTGSMAQIQVNKKALNRKNNPYIDIGAYFGHAAYIEFGTRKLIQIPNELSDYASQFKGKGGFVSYKALLDWVKKRGAFSGAAFSVKSKKLSTKGKKSGAQDRAIKTAAYFIARKLNTVGMKPQPFLYPAFFKERPKFLAKVKSMFK